MSPGPAAGRADAGTEAEVALSRVFPLYLVVFIGFVGYSLMITVFTPLVIGGGGRLLPASSSTSERTVVLGVLLALYPLAQFLAAPVLGALSERFGRRRVLLVSLASSAACYGLIALALHLRSLPLLKTLGFITPAEKLAELIEALDPPAER
ncbi:MAG TPA: hypothetical protein VE401_02630 [Solirubrobacterales bacterium]|jgi:DHA1 family tetracycline resistance protein-like MFS transporter|nr:hypothetical protein [Solirubrobacterales bacterium]